MLLLSCINQGVIEIYPKDLLIENIDLIKQFITNEEEALKNDEQGDFYPSNWHKLNPLGKKVLKDIPDENKVKFFFT